MSAQFAKHQTFDRPQYIVTRDFGKLGLEAVMHPEDTRAAVVEAIATGQIDRVVSVIEVYSVEGSSRDITDDIRDAVDARCAMSVAAE